MMTLTATAKQFHRAVFHLHDSIAIMLDRQTKEDATLAFHLANRINRGEAIMATHFISGGMTRATLDLNKAKRNV